MNYNIHLSSMHQSSDCSSPFNPVSACLASRDVINLLCSSDFGTQLPISPVQIYYVCTQNGYVLALVKYRIQMYM